MSNPKEGYQPKDEMQDREYRKIPLFEDPQNLTRPIKFILKKKPTRVEDFIIPLQPSEKKIRTKIPYFGRDGREYGTYEELLEADRRWSESNLPLKSYLTGRVYPNNSEGRRQMKQDEKDHWDRQLRPRREDWPSKDL